MKVGVFGPIIQDRNIFGPEIIEQPGGVTYYTGCALDALACDVTIFGSCGETVPEFPKTFGGKIIHIEKQGTTTHTNITPVEDPNKRFDSAKVYDNEILPGDINESDIQDLEHIVLGPMFHGQISVPLVEKLKKTGATISLAPQGLLRYVMGYKQFDHNFPLEGTFVKKYNDEIFDLLPFVDYVFLDKDELRISTGSEGLKRGANLILEHGVKVVVVTVGQKGSTIYTKKNIIAISSFPPRELVDPIGAGDSYMAGFIKGLGIYDPNSLKEVGYFAAMVSTKSLETHGPFNQSTDDVLQSLSSI